MFSGRGTSMGVRMTKQVKALGTSSIKTLIESDKFIINDFQLIEEMSTFSRRGNSWMAEDGCNDDLMMCLVIFGWLSNQAFFKELLIQTLERVVRRTMFNTRHGSGFVDDSTR